MHTCVDGWMYACIDDGWGGYHFRVKRDGRYVYPWGACGSLCSVRYPSWSTCLVYLLLVFVHCMVAERGACIHLSMHLPTHPPFIRTCRYSCVLNVKIGATSLAINVARNLALSTPTKSLHEFLRGFSKLSLNKKIRKQLANV